MLSHFHQLLVHISVIATALAASIEQRQSSKLQFAILGAVYQCQTRNLTWTGGVPPYTLIAQSSGSNFIPSDIPIISGTPDAFAIWTVAIPRGYTFRLKVTDSTGAFDEYITLAVSASSNSSCLADTWPITSSSSRIASSTAAPLSSSNTVSSRSSSITASNTAGPGITSNPDGIPSPSNSSSPSSTAARLGAGIGGTVAIVIVILGILYGCRRWKKRRTRLQRTLEPLDLTGEPDKEDVGIIVEPYSHTRQVDKESATPLLMTPTSVPDGQVLGRGANGQSVQRAGLYDGVLLDKGQVLQHQDITPSAAAVSPTRSSPIPSPTAIVDPTPMPMRIMNPEHEPEFKSVLWAATAIQTSSSPAEPTLPGTGAGRGTPGQGAVYVHDDAGPVGRGRGDKEGRVELLPVYDSLRIDNSGS